MSITPAPTNLEKIKVQLATLSHAQFPVDPRLQDILVDMYNELVDLQQQIKFLKDKTDILP